MSVEASPILDVALRILAVLVLVFLNGFFVAAEFALVKVRDTQLRPLILKGNRRAQVADYILLRLDSFLSAAQLGITLASLALGWIGEPVFTTLLGPVFGWLSIDSVEVRKLLSFVIGFSALTFLHITAGEQAPKWLAIQRPLPTALNISYPLLWFYRASYPFVVLLNWASQWLLRQVGLGPVAEAAEHSEDELRLLFSATYKQSGGSSLAREVVLNAIDLRRRMVREVMRPRQDMSVFDTEASIAECLDIAEKTRYSRFPLCEQGELDATLGVVHIKDLFAMRLKARSGRDLLSSARKIIYVPETAHLDKVLQLFLERKLHLAVVVDEYGGTVGMVTLENIIEELVGQIQDEFDQEKPLVTKTSETTWDLDGLLPLHELAELVGEPLEQEAVTTVSGWFTLRVGSFPKPGDTVNLAAYQLRVEELEGNRVSRLSLTRREQLSQPSAETKPQ